MKIVWHFEDTDIRRLRTEYETQRNNSFVLNRIRRNVERNIPQVTKETFWEAHVAALLTTQQRSGPNTAVSRFISARPFALSFEKCAKSVNLREMVERAISNFGGIRRGPTIARECETNLNWLNNDGWQRCFRLTEKLLDDGSAATERNAAESVDMNLAGFGPKQARNLLQMLGLTKYEIPIDSRITRWLNKNDFPIKLTAGPLSDLNYYNFIMDGIKELCSAAGILPCVMDAVIFSSFDPEWPADQLD